MKIFCPNCDTVMEKIKIKVGQYINQKDFRCPNDNTIIRTEE